MAEARLAQRHQRTLPDPAAEDMEAAHQVQTGRTVEHREAANAFVEKRIHFRRPVNRQSVSRSVLDK